MKHSKEILLLATKIERAALHTILSAVSRRYQKEVAPTMPSRAESDSKYAEELQGFGVNSTKSTAETATAVRSVHEASRAQRDVEIINTGHKGLMLACLVNAVMRSEKLEREIKAIEESPQ